MKNILILSIFCFFLSACKDQIRFPAGRGSTSKTPKVEEPSASSTTGYSSKPQPVEGTGNGNGTMDTASGEITNESGVRIFSEVSSEFLVSQRTQAVSDRFKDAENKMRFSALDVLSQTEEWKQLNLPSQFTIFAKNAVLYNQTDKNPDHLLMYISQSEHGVFLVNLLVIPSQAVDYNFMYQSLRKGERIILDNVLLPADEKDETNNVFIVSLDDLRYDNNFMQPYLRANPDTEIMEDAFLGAAGPVQDPLNTTARANKILPVCKQHDVKKLLESEHEFPGCDLEYVEFTLHFGFNLDGHLIIVFEDPQTRISNMIAYFKITDKSFWLDNLGPSTQKK